MAIDRVAIELTHRWSISRALLFVFEYMRRAVWRSGRPSSEDLRWSRIKRRCRGVIDRKREDLTGGARSGRLVPYDRDIPVRFSHGLLMRLLGVPFNQYANGRSEILAVPFGGNFPLEFHEGRHSL